MLKMNYTVEGCFTIFFTVCIFFGYGQVYTMGNMTPYILSYLHEYVDKTVSNNLAVWISACNLCAEGLITPFVGFILPRVGFRIELLSMIIMHALGLGLTALSIKHSFGLMLFTYAFLTGIPLGGSYGVLLQIATSWFPNRSGLIMGICACGFGMGSVIITPIQTIMINPDNIPVNNVTQMFDNRELLDRVPTNLIILGSCIGGLQLLGFIFCHPKPVKKDSDASDRSANSSEIDFSEDIKSIDLQSTIYSRFDDNIANIDYTSIKEYTPRECIRTKNIYLFWTIICLNMVPLALITSTIKIVGQMYIRDDIYLSTVGTVGAVIHMVARFATGLTVDKISFKFLLVTMNIFYCVILITLPYITSIPVAGKGLYFLWNIFFFICIGSNFVLVPTGIKFTYGLQYYPAIYGYAFSAFTPGSMIGSLIIYFVNVDIYLNEVFIACGLICLCNAIVSIFLTDTKMPLCLRPLFCNTDTPKPVAIEEDSEQNTDQDYKDENMSIKQI